MARTDAHTPFHARVKQAADRVEVHRGCDQDPSGRGRYLGMVLEGDPAGTYCSACINSFPYQPTNCTCQPAHYVYVYAEVECDLDEGHHSFLRCHYDSDSVWDEMFRHKCYWPEGLKRSLWYSPERQQARSFGRQAVREYNTFGEVLTDEPATRNNPSGLWGGGWPD